MKENRRGGKNGKMYGTVLIFWKIPFYSLRTFQGSLSARGNINVSVFDRTSLIMQPLFSFIRNRTVLNRDRVFFFLAK